MSESSTAGRQDAAEQEARDTGSIMNFMAARRIGTAMWVMRCYAIFLSIQYMFFCSAFDMGHYFQRAMLANGVVCALRLHQRVPQFRLTRVHFSMLLQEDSAHYLIYSLIFLTCHPITIALMPVAVFALLHASSFTRQMIDMHGSNSYPFARKLINHVAKHQATLFRFVALNEVLILPTVVAMLIMGRASVFAPFLYYKFVHYRYLSTRNPYSRVIFYELRMSAEVLSRNPNCPSILSSSLLKGITFVSKLAPPYQQQQPEQQQ
uniref:transmembrane protein 33 n=1 Tax=Ciona intestinalis TaxID=7719 RepID=UPI000052256E|nr:transmembrane protein 33 [Ciona intestinalis]|eukprot:XP_002129462.1 transmembrane protein 33 [Ciona intestinalis]